jgi:hypothetical protein
VAHSSGPLRWTVTRHLTVILDSGDRITLEPGQCLTYRSQSHEVDRMGSCQTIRHFLEAEDGQSVSLLEVWGDLQGVGQFVCYVPFPPLGLMPDRAT